MFSAHTMGTFWHSFFIQLIKKAPIAQITSFDYRRGASVKAATIAPIIPLISILNQSRVSAGGKLGLPRNGSCAYRTLSSITVESVKLFMFIPILATNEIMKKKCSELGWTSKKCDNFISGERMWLVWATDELRPQATKKKHTHKLKCRKAARRAKD